MTLYLKIQENLSCTSDPIYRIIEIDKNQEVKYSNRNINIPIMVFYLIALKQNNYDLFCSFLKRIDAAATLEEFDRSGIDANGESVIRTKDSFKDWSNTDSISVNNKELLSVPLDKLKEEFEIWKHKILEASYYTIEYGNKIQRFFNIFNKPKDSIVYICETDYLLSNNPLEFIFCEAYKMLMENESSKPFYWDLIAKFPYLAKYRGEKRDESTGELEGTEYDNLTENIKCVSYNGKHYLYCGKAYLLNETGQTVQKL